MANFKVGDRVMIDRESEYWDTCDSNPANVTGTISDIIEDDPEFSIHVKWDNGKWNTYRKYDLVLAKANADENTDIVTVSKDFVRAAYSVACGDWRKKLEEKFPFLINDNFKLLPCNESDVDDSDVYVRKANGEFVKLIGVQLAHYVTEDTDNYDIDPSYLFRALYITNEITSTHNVNILRSKKKSKNLGVVVTFQKK